MSGGTESSSAEGRKRRSSPSTEIQGPSAKYQTEHWREQENRYIKELAELVSANIGEVNSFNVLPDKCAVLRETVSQIRRVGLREREKETSNLNEIQQSDVSSSGQDVVDHEELGPFLLEALDAFFFVVAQDGKIVFASENVGRFLNCSREELMHRSVYSILHPSDHAEFLHNFMPQGYANGAPNGRGGSTFVCRILTQDSLPDGAAGPGKNCCTVQCFTALHSSTMPADIGDVQTCLLCILRPIPERPPVETRSFSTRQDMNGKVIGIEAMKLRSVVKVGWEQLVRECLKAFYNTSLVQQHHLQVKTKGLALSPPYQFSLPDGSMFTAQTRSKLHCNTSLYQDPFIQSLHVLHREMSSGNLQRDPTPGLCPQPSGHGTSGGHPDTMPLSQLPSGWEPSAQQLFASSISVPMTIAHSSGYLSTSGSTRQFQVAGVPQSHQLGSKEVFSSQNDGASSPTNLSHSGLSQKGLLLSSCQRASPCLSGDSHSHLVKSSSGLNNQIPSNMPPWRPQLSTEGQPGLSLITPGARLESIRPLKHPQYQNIIEGAATQFCSYGKSPTRTEVQMGGHGSSDETNGPTVKENNALSDGKSSNNQQGSQTSLSVAMKEKESAILSTEHTAQVPLSSHTQSLTDRHKILHQLLQENDKNPSIQTSVGEPTTLNNNTVSLSAPKNDKGGMQKKEKHILLRYLLDKEEPCNPSSPPLGFGPHSKVDEATAATVDSSDNVDSSQNSINIKCNPSEKEPGNLNSVKQVDDTEPLQQRPEGEANHKDLDRVFEAESHTTQCTPVTFSLASNVRRSMGRSLSATCSPIGAPFPRPGLMRSRSTIAGATSDIGVCSRPHGGQGSFCEPSQARLSSGVTEAMLVGTGSSVQTSGTGQLMCSNPVAVSEGIPQPMCMTNMERAWLGHEGRTVGGSHRADVPRMTLLSASSTRQIQGSVEQALGRPYHLTNCSGGTGACHCDSAMAADVGTGGNVSRVDFPVSLDELLWTQAGGETQVTNNALFQYLDSLLSSVDEEELTKIDHALGIDKFLQAMSSSNPQRMLAAPVGGNVQLRRQVQQRLQAQQRQLVAHGRPMIPAALGDCRNPPVPSYVQKPPAPGQPLLLNAQMMPQLRREILNRPIILQQHQGYTPCSGSMTTMPRLPLGQQHYSYQVASGAVGVGNHAVNASWRGPGPPSMTSRHFGPSLGSQMQTYHFPTTGMPRESAFGAAAGCPTSAELGLVRMPAPGHVTNAAGLDSWHRGGNRISLTPSTQQPFLANRDPGTFNNMNVSVPLGSTNMRSLECTGNASRHPDARPLGSTSVAMTAPSLESDNSCHYNQFDAMRDTDKVSQLQVLADVQCTVNLLGSDSNYTGQSNSLVYHGQSDISAHPPGASGQRNSLLQQLLME